MCFILLAYHSHPDYPLIVAANRDEFYQRPAQSANWWGTTPGLLAGRDLQAGGTWLGINRQGRFATVTNYRAPSQFHPNRRSRGELVTSFLLSEQAVDQFAATIKNTSDQYNPFNILLGDQQRLCYCNNQESTLINLEPGVYALGNALLDTPWPKLVDAKNRFYSALASRDFNRNILFEILASRDIYADHLLPDTGLSIERERTLSALFIEDAEYGTRCTTLITISKKGNIYFEERNYRGVFTGPVNPVYEFDLE